MTPNLSAPVFISCIFILFAFRTDNDLRCRILCRRHMNMARILPCFYSVFLFSGTIPRIYLLFPDDVPHQMTFRDRWHWEATCCRIVFMFVCLLCCFHFCNCEELYSDKGILFFCGHKLSVPGFSVCVKRNPPARPVVFLLQKENPPFGGFSLKKAFFVYFFKTTTPGSSFPSIHSRKAPPAVEM